MAWLGLVPRQHSTGGKPTLLIHGARAVMWRAPKRADRWSRWVVELAARRGPNVAAVALANKNVRTAWALLARGTPFDAEHAAEAA